MFKFFKKFKNNKGNAVAPLLLVPILITTMYFIAFMIDVSIITFQKFTLIDQVMMTGRICAAQGGFEGSIPNANEWNSKRPYFTNGQMFATLNDVFIKNNVSSWNLTINGRTLYNTIPNVDFGKDFVVKGTITYKFKILGGMLPFAAGDKTYNKELVFKSERFTKY